MLIYNFNNIEVDRTRRYGGMAGQKLGVIFNGEKWFLKFPKTTNGLRNVEISYTTAPLSEYLGSKIYESIGVEVHETLLGIKDGKVVVACKDFLEENERLDEFRAIKNDYVENLQEEIGSLSLTSGNGTDLEEIMLIMEKNPVFQEIIELKERFYDMFVIDSLIGNNDRNNGNWGVIVDRQTGNTKVSPVYDNGGSFSNKLSNEQISKMLNDNIRFTDSAYNTRTCAFKLKDKLINPLKYIETLQNDDLNNAVLRIVPKIDIEKIKEIINSIPEKFEGIDIISPVQKEFYTKTIEYRYKNVLVPTLEKLRKNLEHQ